MPGAFDYKDYVPGQLVWISPADFCTVLEGPPGDVISVPTAGVKMGAMFVVSISPHIYADGLVTCFLLGKDYVGHAIVRGGTSLNAI